MNKKRILAVDDNAVNLASIEKALQDEYEVIPMLSGRRALKFLLSEKVDIILLDVQMPAMDGFETLEEIRKKPNGVTVPVIFLTASKDRNTVIQGSKLGIMDYVTKPFDTNNLKARIEQALNQFQGGSMDEETLKEHIESLLDFLDAGKTKQSIAKIVYLLKYQWEDEIFQRLKNVLEAIEKGEIDASVKKAERILEILEVTTNHSQRSIQDRELYVKLLCINAYIENCKTKNALDEVQDTLQFILPEPMQARIKEVENKLKSYDDDEAKGILRQLIEELGSSVT